MSWQFANVQCRSPPCWAGHWCSCNVLHWWSRWQIDTHGGTRLGLFPRTFVAIDVRVDGDGAWLPQRHVKASGWCALADVVDGVVAVPGHPAQLLRCRLNLVGEAIHGRRRTVKQLRFPYCPFESKSCCQLLLLLRRWHFTLEVCGIFSDTAVSDEQLFSKINCNS